MNALPENSDAAIPQAARRLIDGLCSFDVDEAAAGLCEDARLSLSSGACAVGKARVRGALVRALGSVYSIRCEPAAVWIKRNVAIIEADVSCERTDRARISFPLTLVLRFRDQMIAEIRLLTYEPAMAGNFRTLREIGG